MINLQYKAKMKHSVRCNKKVRKSNNQYVHDCFCTDFLKQPLLNADVSQYACILERNVKNTMKIVYQIHDKNLMISTFALFFPFNCNTCLSF